MNHQESMNANVTVQISEELGIGYVSVEQGTVELRWNIKEALNTYYDKERNLIFHVYRGYYINRNVEIKEPSMISVVEDKNDGTLSLAIQSNMDNDGVNWFHLSDRR